jgi:hypothetical protein
LENIRSSSPRASFDALEQDEVAQGFLSAEGERRTIDRPGDASWTHFAGKLESFRNGFALSGCTIQIAAFALPGTPTAARRLPSGPHAKNPLVRDGPSASVEYSASPRLFTNFK